MTETLITNGVTISIALLAGLIALHQVKLNVMASARVKWIDDLREILSLYSSELENCSKLKLDFIEELNKPNGKGDEVINEKFYQPYANSAKEVLKLQSKAFLYLSTKKPDHKELMELLRINSILVHEKHANHREAIQKNIQKIISLAQSLFEIEMSKAKRLFKI